MSGVRDTFSYKSDPNFCEKQLKEIHMELFKLAEHNGIESCGFDASSFDFYRDGDPQQVGIIRFADAKDVYVPQYLRDYVTKTYGDPYAGEGVPLDCLLDAQILRL